MQTEIRFPRPKRSDVTAIYQTYNDMNLATLPESSVKVGPANASGKLASTPGDHRLAWVIGSAVAALAVGVGAYLFMKGRSGDEAGPQRARDAFHLPKNLDGFSLAALLRRLGTSPLVHWREPQKAELQRDLRRVEETCFANGAGTMSESDLRGLAEKWLAQL